MRNPFRLLLERYHSLNMRPHIAGPLIGGAFGVLVALIGLLAIVVQKAPAYKPNQLRVEPPPRVASTAQAVNVHSLPVKATDPYEFTQAVIDSLSWAADARQMFMSIESDDEGAATDIFTDTFHSMTDTRIAINKLRRAKLEVQQFADSENQLAKEAVQLFNVGYDGLIAVLTKSIQSQERMLSISNEKELGALMNEMSRGAAAADEAWKALVYATAAVPWVLADNKRTNAEGKISYLTITADQRAALLKELESHFGESVKQGMKAGKYATEVAPAALWEFLSQPGWRPTDAPDF